MTVTCKKSPSGEGLKVIEVCVMGYSNNRFAGYRFIQGNIAVRIVDIVFG